MNGQLKSGLLCVVWVLLVTVVSSNLMWLVLWAVGDIGAQGFIGMLIFIGWVIAVSVVCLHEHDKEAPVKER